MIVLDCRFTLIAEIPIAECPIAKVPIAECPIAKIPIAKCPIAQIPIAECPIAECPIAQLQSTLSGLGIDGNTIFPAVNLGTEQTFLIHCTNSILKLQYQLCIDTTALVA